jgi:Leucine carboxyl methyltransferase
MSEAFLSLYRDRAYLRARVVDSSIAKERVTNDKCSQAQHDQRKGYEPHLQMQTWNWTAADENMADTQIEHVSDTAFWVAHYRALETKRSDALFRDPLAERLSGDRGEKIAGTMPGRFLTAWAVVVRTCIIDDYIRTAVEGGVDTILNLGCGLDTRPYRMDLPKSLLWVEADYPT